MPWLRLFKHEGQFVYDTDERDYGGYRVLKAMENMVRSHAEASEETAG